MKKIFCVFIFCLVGFSTASADDSVCKNETLANCENLLNVILIKCKSKIFYGFETRYWPEENWTVRESGPNKNGTQAYISEKRDIWSKQGYKQYILYVNSNESKSEASHGKSYSVKIYNEKSNTKDLKCTPISDPEEESLTSTVIQ